MLGWHENTAAHCQSAWNVSGRRIILSSSVAEDGARLRLHSAHAATISSARVAASPTKNDVHTPMAPNTRTVHSANSTANRPDCPTATALAERTLPAPS